MRKGKLARLWRRRSPGAQGAGRSSTAQSELEREQMEERVRGVLAQRALETLLQPIMDLRSGRPVGVEALSRFYQQPLRPPDVWFNEAASVGLGIDLEMLAIRKALEILPRLPSGLYLSLNASVETTMSDEFRDVVGGADTDRLVLEITEHTKVPSYALFLQRIQDLRSMGLRLAVDDAGAGYASFRHVLNLSPDVIKLDIDLTRGIDKDPARRALGSALLTFGIDAYNASMVAEGIETAGELDTLRDLGCPMGQGFYLGRPGRLRQPAGTNAQPGQAPSPQPVGQAPAGRATPLPKAPAAPDSPAEKEDLSVPERHLEEYAQLLAMAAEIRDVQRATTARR